MDNRETSESNTSCENQNGVAHISIREDDYIWKISDFSRHGGWIQAHGLLSLRFITGENNAYIWSLELYPNGVRSECSDYISVRLYLNAGTLPINKLFVKMCLINNNAEEVYISKYISNKITEVENSVCLFDKFIRKDEVLDEKNGLLQDDQLTLKCQLYMYNSLEVYCHDSTRNLTEMLNSRTRSEELVRFTDFELRLGQVNVKLRLLGCE